MPPLDELLAKPWPPTTPQLARRVAELFIQRAVVWRVLIAHGHPTAMSKRPTSAGLEAV